MKKSSAMEDYFFAGNIERILTTPKQILIPILLNKHQLIDLNLF